MYRFSRQEGGIDGLDHETTAGVESSAHSGKESIQVALSVQMREGVPQQQAEIEMRGRQLRELAQVGAMEADQPMPVQAPGHGEHGSGVVDADIANAGGGEVIAVAAVTAAEIEDSGGARIANQQVEQRLFLAEAIAPIDFEMIDRREIIVE